MHFLAIHDSEMTFGVGVDERFNTIPAFELLVHECVSGVDYIVWYRSQHFRIGDRPIRKRSVHILNLGLTSTLLNTRSILSPFSILPSLL